MKNLTLEEAQKIVQEFIEERNWQNPPEEIILHMLEEFGEVARNALKLKNYGGQHTSNSPINMDEEIADVFYCLLKLANATNVDLTKAFTEKMDKNRKRFPPK
mgnify:CR=1 FL=1